jgi:hypothetical protein
MPDQRWTERPLLASACDRYAPHFARRYATHALPNCQRSGFLNDACRWHQGCQLLNSGEFGASPFCRQLPASEQPGGAGKLHRSRINAYGRFASFASL